MNKKLKNKLKKKIRLIPDLPKKGILFQDITSITDNKKLFKEVLLEISKYVKKNKFTKIAAVEARGFIFGSAVSFKTEIPFVPIRKKGKLPGKVLRQKYQLEYGSDEIQIHKNSINERDRVLIIDDLIATGGTAEAAAKLVEISGGKVAGFIFVINLFDLPGNKLLKSKGYFTESLVEFPGH